MADNGGQRRTAQHLVRMTPEEKTRMQARARRDGRALSRLLVESALEEREDSGLTTAERSRRAIGLMLVRRDLHRLLGQLAAIERRFAEDQPPTPGHLTRTLNAVERVLARLTVGEK